MDKNIIDKNVVPFHVFADNTKQMCGVISISLFILIIIMIAPINLSSVISMIGKIMIIIMLSYTGFKNFKETNTLVDNTPDLFSDDQYSIIKNNILLSYTLTFSVMILIIYISYTIIF